MTKLLLAVFLNLWVGWGTLRPFPNVTATVTVQIPSVGISDPWVGINTNNGGLVQVGLMDGEGWGGSAWWVSCQGSQVCGVGQNNSRSVGIGDRVRLGVAYLGHGTYRMSVWDISRGWDVWHFVHGYAAPYRDEWIVETQSFTTPNVTVRFADPTNVGKSLTAYPNRYAGLCPVRPFVVAGC